MSAVSQPLNILVLHRLGAPGLAPLFLRRHVFSLAQYCPGHNILYHDIHLPLPAFIRDTRFDAIVLDVTLLCMRWAGGGHLDQILRDYAWVAESDAVKIALPQDEYDCHAILDDWMCRWKVDVVVSVIARGWDVLYPRYHRQGQIRLGYTGYIDDALIDAPRRDFDSRRIDIGYRARRLPPYFGRIGETKWRIGQAVADRARGTELKIDIELGEAGTLLGQRWFDFLADSKFTLGANSGSSLLDPVGDIQKRVKAYVAAHPEASFEEVEAQCFPGQDGHHAFTAISPRVLEAGLLESCQILVEGDYSHVISPWEHYIPIKPDASDFENVRAAMNDRALVEAMRQRTRTALLDCTGLRAAHRARAMIELIGALKTSKRVFSAPDTVKRMIEQYHGAMTARYRRHWVLQHARSRGQRLLAYCPPALKLARGVRSLLRARR